MVNQHGVNIARLKGAIFIDQGPIPGYESGQHKSERQERKKTTTAREKKMSPINVTIKDTPSKKTCSHDSITDRNNVNPNGSDSFGSVADTAE